MTGIRISSRWSGHPEFGICRCGDKSKTQNEEASATDNRRFSERAQCFASARIRW
jgi:hypothetical protein